MSAPTAAGLVHRLAVAGPPDVEGFAALLGTPLQADRESPAWRFYSFEWQAGPFAGGVLRVNLAGDAALLSLSPRDPPGLTEADLDPAAWGPRRDAVPKPRISSEGADLLVYHVNGVIVSALWTHTSRRLVNLSIEWPTSSSSQDDAELT